MKTGLQRFSRHFEGLSFRSYSFMFTVYASSRACYHSYDYVCERGRVVLIISVKKTTKPTRPLLGLRFGENSPSPGRKQLSLKKKVPAGAFLLTSLHAQRPIVAMPISRLRFTLLVRFSYWYHTHFLMPHVIQRFLCLLSNMPVKSPWVFRINTASKATCNRPLS